MSAGYPETIVGGVYFAPFVRYALGAFVVYLLLARPLLRLLPMQRIFANPPLVGMCVYVLVLTALLVLV